MLTESAVTFNVRGLIHQLKGRNWQSRWNSKIQLGFLKKNLKYKATDTLKMKEMLALLKFQVTILILDKAKFPDQGKLSRMKRYITEW